ncbi:MAG: hypothetical protein ACE5FF_17320 [Saprospiraceae bacterium]
MSAKHRHVIYARRCQPTAWPQSRPVNGHQVVPNHTKTASFSVKNTLWKLKNGERQNALPPGIISILRSKNQAHHEIKTSPSASHAAAHRPPFNASSRL